MSDLFSELMKDSQIADMCNHLKKYPDDVKYHIVFKALMKEVYDRVVPPMDDFLFDKRFLGFRESDVYPEVRNVLNIIDRDDIREVFIVAGKGSGKSVIVGVSQLRELYKALAYVNPSAYFGVLRGTYIAAVNMSINSGQALNVVFKRFLFYLNSLSEFKKLNKQAIIKYKQKSEDKKYSFRSFTETDTFANSELYAETVGMVTFPGKDVVALSGHSKASAFFGYDIIFGSIDEMSWFENGNERVRDTDELPSEEIYQGLSTSAITRFPNHYKLVCISSPRSKVGDPLWKRYEAVKNSGKLFTSL